MLRERWSWCVSITFLFGKLQAPHSHLLVAQWDSSDDYKELPTPVPSPQAFCHLEALDSSNLNSAAWRSVHVALGRLGRRRPAGSHTTCLPPPSSAAWLLTPTRAWSGPRAFMSPPTPPLLALWGARSQQGYAPHPAGAICTNYKPFGSQQRAV